MSTNHDHSGCDDNKNANPTPKQPAQATPDAKTQESATTQQKPAPKPTKPSCCG